MVTNDSVGNTGRGTPEELLICLREHVDNARLDSAEALLHQGAAESIEEYLNDNPERIDAVFIYAGVMFRVGRVEEAFHWYRDILKVEDNFGVYNQLACICQTTGRLTEAVGYLKRAAALKPARLEVKANLAKALFEVGHVSEGIGMYRELVEKDPSNTKYHSSLLFFLHHLPELETEELFSEHLRWASRHDSSCSSIRSHLNSPDPDRKLRIGYLSGDMRRHSAAYFFESLLDGHDRDRYELYGYGNVAWPDHYTSRLAEKFDVYHNIYGIEDAAAAAVIEADKIDILVEMNGHLGDSRVSLLMNRPAPVIVSYLAINTTAVGAVDYRFTDVCENPPGTEKYYTEKLVRLPGCHLCYRPPEFAPCVGPLPLDRNGFITFGSFNNHIKLHPHVIRNWAEILKRCRGSRLVLKFGAGSDKVIKKRFMDQFRVLGVEAGRVNIHGRRKPAEHMAMYNEIDIALDSWPFNGCTTTCEALWMGVPVISMSGENFVSRAALTILNTLDMDFFVANCEKEYIAKAISLAENSESLRIIRNSMRARIASSGLCDASAFALKVEQAYREMWEKWCRTKDK